MAHCARETKLPLNLAHSLPYNQGCWKSWETQNPKNYDNDKICMELGHELNFEDDYICWMAEIRDQFVGKSPLVIFYWNLWSATIFIQALDHFRGVSRWETTSWLGLVFS